MRFPSMFRRLRNTRGGTRSTAGSGSTPYMPYISPPVARAGSDQTVAVGDTVSFDGLGSIGTNLSYSWDFGADADPLTGSGATPSCTYNEPGAKIVTLTVMNTVTKVTDSDDVTINVGVVARAGSDQIVAVNTAVSFDGSDSVGTNLSYSWDFW